MAKLTKATPKKKAAPKKANGSKLGAVSMSSDLTLRRWTIVVHGARGAGKTWLGATASKYFPKTIPSSKMVTLEDMLWLQFDAGATDGFSEAGFRVPTMDMSMIMGEEDIWREAGFRQAPSITETANYMAKVAGERFVTGETEIVVVDTVSTYNYMLDDHCARLSPNDTRAKYGMMFQAHKAFYTMLKKRVGKAIFLAHSKALFDDATPEQKKRSLAHRGALMPDIVPRITGQGADVYIDDASLEVLITAREVAGKKNELKRTVYTAKKDGGEAKNRFQQSLDLEEPPHFGKMFAKVEKNVRR